MTAATEITPGTLRRRMTPWTPRDTMFTRLPGAAARTEACPPLTIALRVAENHDMQNVLLTGGWNAATTPEREWWVDSPSACGWTVERYISDPRSAVYRREDGTGRRIHVRMSAAWYDAATDRQTIQAAHDALGRLLRMTFDRGVTLFGTPARTGQDLLLRSLPQYRGALGRETPYEYAPAPDDVRDILRHNFGQGRLEFVAADDVPPLEDLYILDARWMYAAHLRNLPVGPWTHDDAPDFEPYRPGFYRVAFSPPSGWQHIGLLPVWDGAQRTFPRRALREPGRMYNGWATEPEVRLAIKHGWDVRVCERILAAPTSQAGADPAREWCDRLVTLRGAIETGKIRTPDGTAPLLKSALRHILIDTVGSWNRGNRRELHVTMPGAESEIPPDAEDVTPIYADAKRKQLVRVEWYSRGNLDTMQAPMYRPEWSVMVWGRSRAALNAEALQYPIADEIALRSDALALRRLDRRAEPAKPDDGKPGRFRVKRHWHFDAPGVSTPLNETEWRIITGGQE